MAEPLTPELCVIGAGAGGLAVAVAAAGLGLPVVLVEKGTPGGSNRTTGGAAMAALAAAGCRAEAVRSSAPFGIKAQRPGVEFYQVNDHVQGVIAALAPDDTPQRLAGLGIRLIEGEARFKDAATVTVGDGVEIKAKRFVIATGSVPVLPPIAGLDKTPYLTAETVFEARERPKSLAVIGGGSDAIELAQALRRLGSDVTVLAAEPPLSAEDPECAAVVLDRLTRDGVVLRVGVAVTQMKRIRNRIELELEVAQPDGSKRTEQLAVSDVLLASGRKPAIEGLGLEAAGISVTANGITIDKRLRTTNKAVYAIGDVTGAPLASHAARHHADLFVRGVLLGEKARFAPHLIPRVVLTDPELAHVGLTEIDAREHHRAIRVLRWGCHDTPRARAQGETSGHIKVIADKKGTILGTTIVGPSAGELITPWTLAIGQGVNIRAFAGIAVPYPALSEMSRRAAASFGARWPAGRGMRRILNWLRGV